MPRELRVVRGTLLLATDLMTADGVLEVLREKLADQTGLPPRTLNRHLARAVESGWLAHDVAGGNGRRSRYTATMPSCRPEVAHNPQQLQAMSGPPQDGVAGHSLVPNSAAVAGQLVAHSIDRASVSEHLALDQDQDRERGPDHDDSRAAPDHGERKGSSEDEPPVQPAFAADSRRPGESQTERLARVVAIVRRTGCAECQRRSVMMTDPTPCPVHQDHHDQAERQQRTPAPPAQEQLPDNLIASAPTPARGTGKPDG